MPCILDVRPGAWNGKEKTWAWEKTLGEYEREKSEDHSIIELVEQPFGDNYRSVVDTAIALGTIFFAETLSPDGLSRVHTETKEYSEPIALSLDKLRFYATCCMFHQIADENARLIIVPMQVAGTHYACAVSVVRSNDFSDISWLRTFHFYTMILSRVVLRRFRRDVRSFYLGRVQEFLVAKFDAQLHENPGAVKKSSEDSITINWRKAIKETNNFIKVLTRRVPYQRIILKDRPFPGKESYSVTLRVRAKEAKIYFTIEDDECFPRFRVPLDKRQLTGVDQEFLAAEAYLNDRQVKNVLERAVERINHRIDRYLDYIDGFDSLDGI
ncbi:hypothetical protein CKO36_18260 [Rhabdochromatium marinum]|nr:hypothetical protein [Rhabdochromatium marinum]